MKIKVAKDDSVKGCLLVEVGVVADFCQDLLDYLDKYGRMTGCRRDADLMPVVGAELLHAFAGVDWSHMYDLLTDDIQKFTSHSNNKGVSHE